MSDGPNYGMECGCLILIAVLLLGLFFWVVR